jgi:hypothetical protein
MLGESQLRGMVAREQMREPDRQIALSGVWLTFTDVEDNLESYALRRGYLHIRVCHD